MSAVYSIVNIIEDSYSKSRFCINFYVCLERIGYFLAFEEIRTKDGFSTLWVP